MTAAKKALLLMGAALTLMAATTAPALAGGRPMPECFPICHVAASPLPIAPDLLLPN